MISIIFNELRDAIYEKIDAQLVDHPALVEHREAIYSDLLRYFDEHGVIPDFSLQEKEPQNA